MISASSWRKRAWLMAGVLGLMAAAALPSMAEEQSVTMLDFEEPETMGAVFPQAGVKAERVAAHATQGGNALKVTFPAYDPKGNLWPAVTCRFDAPRDWTGCRMAKVDVYNPQAEKAEIGVLYENKHWHDYFSVEPGQTRTIEIPLADANAVNCVQFLMRLRDSQPKTPTLFFVDNFRLVSHSLSDANAVELFFRRPVSLGRLPASVPATRIVAVIRVATADADGAVGRVRMGTVVKSAPIVNGEAVIPLPVPQKDTTVTGELLDKNGKGIWSKTQEIRVLPPVPGQSGFDENGVCYVDGKPFFPIGIFNPSAEDMSLYKEMGFNCVGPYIFASATNVEAAQKNGLKLLSEGAEPNVRGRSLNEAKSLITEAMRNCPDRSVVLGYFVYDEPNPGSAPSADILKLCAEVVSADPNRAVVGINNAYYDEYAGDADVMMVDAYGFPDNSFNIILDRLSSALRAMKGRGPVWLTPQCFGWSLYCLGDTQPTEEHGRAPSFDELRSSQWLGVVLGAQGIVWYTAFAQDDATRYVWPVSWEGLKYATQEIAALQDVLVKPSVPLKSSHAKVYAAGRNLGDGVVVIVVNTADEELSVEIKDVPAQKLLHLDATGELGVKDGAFTDTLPGRTTRLYASRPLNARLPEIAVARARLAAEQQKEDQARADDLARYECGAAVESSWGFSTEAPAAAWRRMIDGRRGSSYKIGDPGFFLKRAGKTSPDAALSGAGRWVEVRLPKPCAIGSIAVVSQNAQFDIACGIGADLKLVPAQRSGSDAHNAAPVDIAEAMLVPPRTIDRVRIQFTRDPLPGKGERIFEIEARKAP